MVGDRINSTLIGHILKRHVRISLSLIFRQHTKYYNTVTSGQIVSVNRRGTKNIFPQIRKKYLILMNLSASLKSQLHAEFWWPTI